MSHYDDLVPGCWWCQRYIFWSPSWPDRVDRSTTTPTTDSIHRLAALHTSRREYCTTLRQMSLLHWRNTTQLSCFAHAEVHGYQHTKNKQKQQLRHHYRARNWTFDENHFWSLSKFPLQRIFWWKPCEKLQWRSWYKIPSKLLGCIGFLYKVVHKTGRFSLFIFTFYFSF